MIETVFGVHAYESLKITVVGAGAAGLLAAYRLKMASLNVEVVEARSRVGGRLFSAPLLDAEFGAWSFSNAGQPELFRSLASEFGLEVDEGYAPFKYLIIEDNQFVDVSSRFFVSYGNDIENTRRRLENIISFSDTVQDAFDAFYHDQPFLKNVCEMMVWGYHGSAASKLSAALYKESIIQMCLGGVSEVYRQGPHMAPFSRLRGGNDLFAKRMAQHLKDEIRLNKPLKSIKKSYTDRLTLSFEDGTKSDTDVLVLAVPVSSYKDLEIEEGIIPATQLESIRQICPGNIIKIMVPALGTQRPQGFVLTEDYGAAMNEHEKFLTLFWRTDFDLERLKKHVEKITKALNWQLPTNYIFTSNEVVREDYPPDAVYISDWVNASYTNGSFCAYSPANEPYLVPMTIEGVAINSLFKPSGSVYFAGEAAGVRTPPGTLGAAFESAENVAALIKQRLLFLMQ